MYGQVNEYVDGVVHIFEKLKKKYPGVGVEGDCYADSTITHGTSGAYFHCAIDEKKLHINYGSNWQKCMICEKYYETSVTYNSESWENDGEGYFYCLCSPICMLEYCVSADDWGYICTSLHNKTFWDEETLEYVMDREFEKKIV